MGGIVRFLELHFMPVAGKIADQRHLKAVRDGIVVTIPLLLIGSLFLVIAFPPIQVLADAVKPYMGALLTVVNTTFGIMSLIAAFSIAYFLAASYKQDPLSGGLISLSCFILACPFTKTGDIAGTLMGSKSLFMAIIIAICTVEIQNFLVKKNIVITLPAGVPPTVSRSFVALIPGFVSLTLMLIINSILGSMELSIPQIIEKVLTAPLMNLGGTLPAMLIAVFAVQLFWSFGIHGAALLNGIMGPIWLGFTEQNAAAKAAGAVIPNIMCQQFLDMFIYIGGSGTTLALALLMFSIAKSTQLKALGRTALWPGLFNINEPITFGMPIVMNPVMMIPFILAPLACVLTTYSAMAIGLVEKPFALTPWTTPVLFSGFLATGDYKAILLQVVNFAVAGAIYYPFLKAWDSAKYKEEQENGLAAQRPAAAKSGEISV